LGYESGPGAIETVQEAKTFGMLCHLLALSGFIIPFGSIIGPLVIWLIKKDQYPFVNDQGKESLNFQITVAIAMIASALLMFVLIGFILLPIIAIGALVMVIIATVAASGGTYYRYPFNIRFIK
jgi:uncharacterized Tic20 family protein